MKQNYPKALTNNRKCLTKQPYNVFKIILGVARQWLGSRIFEGADVSLYG